MKKHFLWAFIALFTCVELVYAVEKLERTQAGYTFETVEPNASYAYPKAWSFEEGQDDDDYEGFYYYNDTSGKVDKIESCPDGECNTGYQNNTDIYPRNRYAESPHDVEHYPPYYRKYPIYIGHRYGPFFGAAFYTIYQ